MKKGRRILLAYIDESSNCSSKPICMEVEVARIFDEIKLCTEKDMSDFDPKLGYHSKKAIAILDIMNRMEDDDILLYSESSIPDKKVLKEWFKIVSKNSAFFFYYGTAADNITKMLMHDFYYKTKLLPSLRLEGKLFLLKKSSMYLIEEWHDRLTNSHSPANMNLVSEYDILSSIIYSHLDDTKIMISIKDRFIIEG